MRLPPAQKGMTQVSGHATEPCIIRSQRLPQGNRGLRTAAGSGVVRGNGGHPREQSGTAADNLLNRLHQRCSPLEPVGAIEIHRLKVRVVANLHREIREPCQIPVGLHIRPSSQQTFEQKHQIVGEGREITKLIEPGL